MPNNITVMIVDDSKVMRKTVMSVFARLEAKVVCNFVEAIDGEEALMLLRKVNKLDLIILDWNMPKMSGIDFLKQVKALEQYKELPIIMVTSETSRASVIEALKYGATDYITKPIQLAPFQSKLEKLKLFS